MAVAGGHLGDISNIWLDRRRHDVVQRPLRRLLSDRDHAFVMPAVDFADYEQDRRFPGQPRHDRFEFMFVFVRTIFAEVPLLATGDPFGNATHCPVAAGHRHAMRR